MIPLNLPVKAQSLSWGSFPFDDFFIWSPLTPGLPSPVRCAFRFFQPLSAFLLQMISGLISCRFRPWGFYSPELFPQHPARTPSRGLIPSCRLPSRIGSTTGFLAEHGSVVLAIIFQMGTKPDALLSFHPLQGFPIFRGGTLLVPPLMGFLQSAHRPDCNYPTEYQPAKNLA